MSVYCKYSQIINYYDIFLCFCYEYGVMNNPLHNSYDAYSKIYEKSFLQKNTVLESVLDSVFRYL